MNHCLVFGARGHLAKTRIIPALEKRGCPYTSVSRGMSPRLVTEHTKDIHNLVAFMSIPTHNFEENVTPYMNEIDPLYILEKPHGHSLEDFEKLKKFIDDNNLKVVYNDHYLGKAALEEIETFEFPSNMKTIKIVLRESANINERITYFDSVGILGDMYQSHCVLIFAAILTRITGKHTKRDPKRFECDQTPCT
jgi:glucose-6-phosphate 1-dehydrogenase